MKPLMTKTPSLAKLRVLTEKRRNVKGLVAAIEDGNVLGRHNLSVQVQTTSGCNGKCHFCPYVESWHKDHPGRMDDELYHRIIDAVSKYKIAKFCPYLENEPLMDGRLFERIEHAISRLDFMLLELATNAVLLDESKLDDVVRIFPGVPHEISISFHGTDKESYETIMGLDYDRALTNVLALLEKAQDHDLKIAIRGAGASKLGSAKMPTWFSQEDFETFWNTQCDEHGFDKRPRLDYFPYHDRAGTIRRNEINFSHVVRRDLNGFYCLRADQCVHFLYTGELILCCMDYHRETLFGDIREQGLEEIFAGERFRELARRMTGTEESPADFICKRCISPGG